MASAIRDQLEKTHQSQGASDPTARKSVFQTILIAADGSEVQDSEVRAALSVSDPGTSISTLHVSSSPIDDVLPTEPPEEPCPMSAATDWVLDEVCNCIPPEHRGRRIYREGDVDREVMDAAREIGADLLVVGTHGRGILARAVLGSTTAYVLRHAGCPVLVTAPTNARSQAGSAQAKRILLAVDADEGPSRAAADLAARLAPELDAHLAMVHIVQRAPDFVPEYGIMVEGALQPHLDHRGQAFLKSFALHLPDGSAIHQIVRSGEPAEEIIAAAQEWKADLIVMGTHGRRGIGRMLLGSTAEKVVRCAPCPVLCVPFHAVAHSASS